MINEKDLVKLSYRSVSKIINGNFLEEKTQDYLDIIIKKK